MRVSFDLTNSDGSTQAFCEFHKTRSKKLRDQIVEGHMNLVRYLAGKFADRGIPVEDLIQVGAIGLINAVDRFEPVKGFKFSTFATPTIVGEIRRHFRDLGWSMKVPRRLQELNRVVNRTRNTMAGFGPTPTDEEIAAELGVEIDEVLAAIELGLAYETISIDTKVSSEVGVTTTLAEFVGANDLAVEEIENELVTQELLAKLPPRMQLLIQLRFFDDLNQPEIGYILGISQMHVSRLLFRAIKSLRLINQGESPLPDKDVELDFDLIYRRYRYILKETFRKRGLIFPGDEKRKQRVNEVIVIRAKPVGEYPEIGLRQLAILLAIRLQLPSKGIPDFLTLSSVVGLPKTQTAQTFDWLVNEGFVRLDNGEYEAVAQNAIVSIRNSGVEIAPGLAIYDQEEVNLDTLAELYKRHGGRTVKFVKRAAKIAMLEQAMRN